jgi:hypothetical protein
VFGPDEPFSCGLGSFVHDALQHARDSSALSLTDGEIGPVFGITYARELHERTAEALAG